MKARQTIPRQWLIAREDDEWGALLSRARKLPAGSGILLLAKLGSTARRQLHYLAKARAITLAFEEPGTAARVHNLRQLTRARLQRAPLILISPVYPTSSHPEWKPLPRMRAATLARLANRRAIALGGMNARRHAKVAPLGLVGWAGISAFRT
jgi:thiamine-phosphate pyrophosphorylase